MEFAELALTETISKYPKGQDSEPWLEETAIKYFLLPVVRVSLSNQDLKKKKKVQVLVCRVSVWVQLAEICLTVTYLDRGLH